jgi:hypothetical protein
MSPVVHRPQRRQAPGAARAGQLADVFRRHANQPRHVLASSEHAYQPVQGGRSEPRARFVQRRNRVVELLTPVIAAHLLAQHRQ